MEIAACLEQEEWARTAAIGKLGIHFEEDSYENWLKKDVDIVAIGVKYGLRGMAILAALKAGKHVISDKPICTSMEELLEIEKLAEEKALKVGCMLDLRYISSVQSARKLLGEKSLGEVRNLSFTGQHCIDYANRPTWYFEEGMHGGTVNDQAIHGIDLIRELTGLEIVQTDGIRSWNAYAVKNPEYSDCAVFMTRLSNGAELMADVSYSAPTQVFFHAYLLEFSVLV